MSYLDPSILRLAKQPELPRGERETIRVYDRHVMWDLRPGQHIEVSGRSATVVSWDRDSGELVVDYDADPGDAAAAIHARLTRKQC